VRKMGKEKDAALGAVLADCPLNQQLGPRREEEEDLVANSKLFTIYSYSLQERGSFHIVQLDEMVLDELMGFNLVIWSGEKRQPQTTPLLIRIRQTYSPFQNFRQILVYPKSFTYAHLF
jgi:hypothetical protein